jgi:GGDEF domain-containing protein
VLLARLDRQLNEHNDAADRQFSLSISRGVARFEPDAPKSLQQLLEMADGRLYEAKRARKAEMGIRAREP